MSFLHEVVATGTMFCDKMQTTHEIVSQKCLREEGRGKKAEGSRNR